MNITMNIRNPRNGQFDYVLDCHSVEDIRTLAQKARLIQKDWEQQAISGRCNALQQWKKELTDRKDEIISALSIDTGRTTESIIEFETLLNTIDRWCGQAGELLDNTARFTSSVAHLSIGKDYAAFPVVGVISPWNFPLLLSLLDAIPALLCGCTVIIKPSEVTPRFIAPLQASIDAVDALKGKIHYIAGDGAIGAALIDEVDMIVFTGSVATGRKVGEAAARNFIPAFLELGGKDPAIVTANADIKRAAKALAWGGMTNAGQSCLSIERIYVDEKVHDEFLESLVSEVSKLQPCTDENPEGKIGPVISDKQASIIQEHFDDALGKGAIAQCGGSIDHTGGGLWCTPTVLSNVNHDMKIMTEETFAAVLPVMPYKTIEQAIEYANDSEFGLSAAIFADSTESAMEIASQLNAGAISINDCGLTAVIHEGEKQSFKLSGLGGSRMGSSSIYRFLRKKALLINDDRTEDPWWFN